MSLTLTFASKENESGVNWVISLPAVSNFSILSILSEAIFVTALASTKAVVD